MNVLFFEHRRTACRRLEARWEDYVDAQERSGSPPPEDLAAHLERCAHCRQALEEGRLARQILRGALPAPPEPPLGFAARVLARIRAEETAGARAAQFWRPLELLAFRLALAAAVALLVLTVYVFQFVPTRYRAQAPAQTEVSEGLPEPGRQPADSDEVLLSLAGREYGR